MEVLGGSCLSPFLTLDGTRLATCQASKRLNLDRIFFSAASAAPLLLSQPPLVITYTGACRSRLAAKSARDSAKPRMQTNGVNNMATSFLRF